MVVVEEWSDARGGRVFRTPRPRESLAEGEARRDPADRRRVAASVPDLRCGGRPSEHVAARRDRRRARRGVLASSARGDGQRRAVRRERARHRAARRRDQLARSMTSPRRYPRTARLNESLLEVLADVLGRLSDPRLELVTITGVDV